MELDLLLTILITGLAGSFTHCIGMCSPFIFIQSDARLKNTPLEKMNNFTRFKLALLIPYHLGRITSYSLLAIITYLLTYSIRDTEIFRYISLTLLIITALSLIIASILNLLSEQKLKSRYLQSIANSISISKLISYFKSIKAIIYQKLVKTPLLFIKILLKKFGKKLDNKLDNKLGKKPSEKLTFTKFILKFIGKSIRRLMGGLWQNPSGFNGYLLGIILGFLPCGFIYMGIMMAVFAGDTLLLTAFYMAIFTLATVPALFISALLYNFVLHKLQKKIKIIMNILMIIAGANIIILFARLYSG